MFCRRGVLGVTGYDDERHGVLGVGEAESPGVAGVDCIVSMRECRESCCESRERERELRVAFEERCKKSVTLHGILIHSQTARSSH